jgi:hypothetical protein
MATKINQQFFHGNQNQDPFSKATNNEKKFSWQPITRAGVLATTCHMSLAQEGQKSSHLATHSYALL